MKNSEIELEVLQRFGLEDTIKFCEMISHVYELKHKEISKNNYDEKDYGYDAKWWKDKAKELKERLIINNKTWLVE